MAGAGALERDRARFSEALLEVQLLQSELAHRGGQNGRPQGESPGGPMLSRDQQLLDRRQQQERQGGLGGTEAGAGSSSSLELRVESPADVQRMRQALAEHFQAGGTQLQGDTDTICHRGLGEGEVEKPLAEPGAGGELPPLSMLRGIPQREGREDYVRSVSAAEQEFASEEMDAA